MSWGLVVAGAGMAVGGGLSYMGQRDARRQSGDQMDAQERQNMENLAFQRESEMENWNRYLQSLGYNMGRNPNLPGPQEMPFVPSRLAPYMVTERIVPQSQRTRLPAGSPALNPQHNFNGAFPGPAGDDPAGDNQSGPNKRSNKERLLDPLGQFRGLTDSSRSTVKRILDPMGWF
jgi:hypothetical protein